MYAHRSKSYPRIRLPKSSIFIRILWQVTAEPVEATKEEIGALAKLFIDWWGGGLFPGCRIRGKGTLDV